jgi:transcription initiation factor TFIIH subunit 1
LSEDEFWARFFMSRLKKKLSGERITDRDPVDDIMDRYLRPDYDRSFLAGVTDLEINKKRPRQEEVPNFIDLEGNEEHVSKVSTFKEGSKL